MSAATPSEALDVTAFWREAGPKKWFAKDDAFDVTFRDRCALAYSRASRRELIQWRGTPEGALAEILLLDQYPRNVFRGTPWSFATDNLAREAANAAVQAGHDAALEKDVRAFIYMPFEHSEDMADQDRAVDLLTRLDENYAFHARSHRDLIVRFGRFPYRNDILGRASTPEERAFLEAGGYSP